MKTMIRVLLGVMLTASIGRIQFNGHFETWYNLPMHNIERKAVENGYPDDFWIRADGCRMIGHYIICAGAEDRYGEVVETSRGEGLILDTGEFVREYPDAIDLAVTWQK